MPVMVVLSDATRRVGAVDAVGAIELARVGVTCVSLVHDEAGTGVVVEGWAFDPFLAGERAAAIVAGAATRVRTLHPLLQTAVASERRIG